MAGEGPEERDAEDQVQAALEAMQGTALRLLQEGETHPQLMALAAAMAAGQLAAATALAGGAPGLSAPRREPRVERHAAVDVERRAGHVVGLVGGQPDGGAGDVLGLADPLVGDQPHQVGVGLGRLPGGGVDRRVDRKQGAFASLRFALRVEMSAAIGTADTKTIGCRSGPVSYFA